MIGGIGCAMPEAALCCVLRVADPGANRAAADPPMRIDLREAVDADVPFLHDLEERCMRDHALAQWGAWSPRPSHLFVLAEHRVILAGGADAGCVAVKARVDHLWLDKLYILPELQRRGIGRRVLDIVRTEAASRRIPVKLSVIRSNPAIEFYRTLGFGIDAETDDAFRMTKA